jgi:hypothetical protein
MAFPESSAVGKVRRSKCWLPAWGKEFAQRGKLWDLASDAGAAVADTRCRSSNSKRSVAHRFIDGMGGRRSGQSEAFAGITPWPWRCGKVFIAVKVGHAMLLRHPVGIAHQNDVADGARSRSDRLDQRQPSNSASAMPRFQPCPFFRRQLGVTPGEYQRQAMAAAEK